MQVKIAILGYGKRGSIYATYAKNHPDKFKVVAVAETDAVKREIAKANHNCPVFEDLREKKSAKYLTNRLFIGSTCCSDNIFETGC